MDELCIPHPDQIGWTFFSGKTTPSGSENSKKSSTMKAVTPFLAVCPIENMWIFLLVQE